MMANTPIPLSHPGSTPSPAGRHERDISGTFATTHDDFDDASSFDDPAQDIRPENIPNTIYTKSPEDRFRLGTWSVVGLVVNRMIGSGIFNSPSTVMRGTHSVGISLLFWAAGALYGIAGTYLYTELGLSIPRHHLNGVDTAVPRSGGTLNYLQYIFPWPAYKPGTAVFVTCLFAVTFVVLGNMAGNCLIFGIRVLMAANVPVNNASVRGIAIALATVACLIHAFSRRGAIQLGNIIALIKVLILVLIIITAICASAGAFHSTTYTNQNLSIKKSFADPSQSSYGYAQAFLAVMFASNGFEQPNYVLGEIKQPHTTFPKGSAIGIAIVYTLYMLVNISYMVVVPEADQLNPNLNVAQQFFTYTFSRVANGKVDPQRILSSFIAISTFGNVVVMTFVAARIKQEIAKEGILPGYKFFGSSRDVSLGRVLKAAHKKQNSFVVRKLWWIFRRSWLDPREHSEKTPVGALFLHWFFTVFIILVTSSIAPLAAYDLLVGLYSYAVVAIFGFLLAVGMLKLRLSSREKWRSKSKASPMISITAALVFGIGCSYPIAASWIPPKGTSTTAKTVYPWFTVPTVSWSVLGMGVVWYLGFLTYAARRLRKDKVEFKVERVADFVPDPAPHGPLVQVHETVYLAWVAKEVATSESLRQSMSSRGSY